MDYWEGRRGVRCGEQVLPAHIVSNQEEQDCGCYDLNANLFMNFMNLCELYVICELRKMRCIASLLSCTGIQL